MTRRKNVSWPTRTCQVARSGLMLAEMSPEDRGAALRVLWRGD
jgi:hypothetical protein